MNKRFLLLITLLLSLCLAFAGCDVDDINESVGNLFGDNKTTSAPTEAPTEDPIQAGNADSVLDVPEFSGSPYVVINNDQPEFTEDEITTTSYEIYSELDSLGRCGVTHACVGRDIMPTEDRGNISSVKPTGWINNTYDTDLVDGGHLYNRCHLIGFQLTGENANKENLITGTRYMNVDGMLPFENQVADYVKETGNHVMYRVTPIFEGNNLVASGVQMEAYSVEDNGAGVCFNVYAYNVQPGITIDYATGENWLSGEDVTLETDPPDIDGVDCDYILNTSKRKIHLPSCSGVSTMSDKNKQEYSGSIDDLLSQGYTRCGTCNP